MADVSGTTKITVKPYELLIRFDHQTGEFKGAAFYAMETITVDDKVVSQKETAAVPLDDAYNGPYKSSIESVLKEFESMLTAENTRLTQAVADKDKEIEGTVTKKDQEIADVKAQANKAIADLNAKLAKAMGKPAAKEEETEAAA